MKVQIITEFSWQGCRSASINLEARSLTGWSTQRHCIVTKLQDLTVDHFRNIRTKAGALLVILPDALHSLSLEDRKVSEDSIKFIREIYFCNFL